MVLIALYNIPPVGPANIIQKRGAMTPSEAFSAEASITAMQADLSAFKEELADTLYLMRGRGLA